MKLTPEHVRLLREAARYITAASADSDRHRARTANGTTDGSFGPPAAETVAGLEAFATEIDGELW